MHSKQALLSSLFVNNVTCVRVFSLWRHGPLLDGQDGTHAHMVAKRKGSTSTSTRMAWAFVHGTEGFVGVEGEPRIGPRETSIRGARICVVPRGCAPQSVLIRACYGPGPGRSSMRVPRAGKPEGVATTYLGLYVGGT